MSLYLVRHAPAASRSGWQHDDRLRPLTREGRYHAADLVAVLGDRTLAITAVLSSPYRRCIETVAPLAAALGVALTIDEALAEGSPDRAIALVRSMASIEAVFCSHGDIIPALLDAVAREDNVDLGPSPRCQKASTWVLDPAPDRPGRFVRASYLPPPR